MKKLKTFGFLAMIALIASSSGCKKASPEPQNECIEGVVIAEQYNRITSTGIMGACETIVQIKNRAIGGKFMNQYDNCVVIRNLDTSLAKLNQRVYFESFVQDTQCGPWQADCFFPPSSSCIIATNLSTQCNSK